MVIRTLEGNYLFTEYAMLQYFSRFLDSEDSREIARLLQGKATTPVIRYGALREFSIREIRNYLYENCYSSEERDIALEQISNIRSKLESCKSKTAIASLTPELDKLEEIVESLYTL